MKVFWKEFHRFLHEEDGIGIVEIILILVILIMLIVIFRTQITSIIESAFANINGGAGDINTEINIK